MRVPMSWLRDPSPPGLASGPSRGRGADPGRARRSRRSSRSVPTSAASWSRAVLDVEELEGFKKPIRYCRVDDGDADPRDRLRRDQLRRRRPGRLRAAPALLPGGFRIERAQDLRPDLRRHDLLRPRAGHRRRPQRHPRAARRPSAGCRRGGRPAPARRRARHRRHPRTAATRCRCAGSPARWRRRSPAASRDPADVPTPAPDAAGYHVRVADVVRLRPLRRPRRQRRRPDRRQPAVAAAPADAGRHAPDLAGRGRHQLRHAGARPAAARLRPRPPSPAPSSYAGRSRASGCAPSTASIGPCTPTTCSSPTTAARSRSPA